MIVILLVCAYLAGAIITYLAMGERFDRLPQDTEDERNTAIAIVAVCVALWPVTAVVVITERRGNDRHRIDEH